MPEHILTPEDQEFVHTHARLLAAKILDHANLMVVETTKASLTQISHINSVSSLLGDQILGLSVDQTAKTMEIAFDKVPDDERE